MTPTVSSSSPQQDVVYQRTGHIEHVTLNRPRALNALSLQMVRDLTPKLKEWANDPHISVVTLRGAGEKAFNSGGDLKNITFSAKGDGSYGREFFYEEFTLNYMIGTFPKPFISILNGLTYGGAAGLSVIGRFCVATERTIFSMPECAIGLFPDVGSGFYLSRLRNNIGVFLALTGQRVMGRDLVNIGLASHYIDYDQIKELDSALVKLTSPTSMEDVQDILDSLQAASTTQDDPSSFSVESHKQQIAQCFSGNSLEDIVLRLKHDGSPWAHSQLEVLGKMSPTSLKVTLRHMQEGINMDLASNLHMEYRLTQRCFQDKDFHEGIRATLIDKDRNPQWSPATLEEVTEERLQHYFSPLVGQDELRLSEKVFH